MAHGKSLELRKIQPHPRPAGRPQPNEWRRMTKAIAKKLNLPRRRVLRRINKRNQQARELARVSNTP